MRRGARVLPGRLATASALVLATWSLLGLSPVSAAPAPRNHHVPAAAGAALAPAQPLGSGRAPARQPGAVTSVAAPSFPAAGAADVDLATTSSLTRAAGLPIQVASSIASRAHVEVLDHATAQKAGVSGFLFKVRRADGGGQTAPVTARLDYSGFAQAFGGGFGSRLTVVALPGCAAITPQLPACQQATPLPTVNDTVSHTLTVQLDAQPAPGTVTTMAATDTVLAATTTTSGGSGDFKASSLSPSATWDVGLQTGDFTWSYPLPAAPPVGGAPPSLALVYDSGATDGETAQTNSQPSQVGEGFQLAGGGFVERRYKSCADEITSTASKTGDLCWGGDNAYVSVGGRASELVKDDGSGAWRLKDDDGSRVELLSNATNGANNGEYWRLTTTDGTQYYFGKNQLPGYASGDQATNSVWTVPVVGYNSGEPCHGADYDSSMCYQAWRWNLDLVIDPNGNASEYFYTSETNYYLFDSTGSAAGTAKQYTRGGYLNEVGYSSRSGNVYAHIPMRAQLTYGDRCLSGSNCSTHTAQYWPDTPWDLNCSGSGCGQTGHEAPSFWTQKMLTGVTTQVYQGSAGYVNVDSWSLGHQFLSADTDDLWLSSITHTGHDGGSLALDPVSITGTSYVNRVAGDGYSPMYKYRVTAIHSETGQQIAVTYNNADCGSARPTPSTDQLPCFEQWWTPGDPQTNNAPVDSWFFKYPTASVTVHDDTNASPDDMVTSYTYLDGTAWHYDNDDGLVKNKYKSYGQWRGYEHVHVVTGSSSETQGETDYTFMRGMDGDHLPDGTTRSVSIKDSQNVSIPDSERWNAFTRERVTLNGPGGAEVSGTIDDPWQSATTASSVKSWGTLTARLRGIAAAHDRADLASGGTRTTEVDNTFDGNGLVTQSSDLSDGSAAAGQLCIANTYAQDTTTWMLDYVSERTVHAAACGSSGALVSDTRHLFDSAGFGTAPVHGDVTEVDEWSAGDPGVAGHWVATSRNTYDSYGRLTSSKDALGNLSSTTYNSAYGSGNAITQTVATNPLGWTTTTDLDSARGLTLDSIDANGERTDLGYDPLGRLTAAWLPGQSKASSAKANFTYSYQVSNTAPTAITTNRLINPNGTYVTSVTLYDGLLRARQTQRVAEAVSNAMLVTDTLYNSRGEVVTENADYAVTGAPSAKLYGVSQSNVPSYNVYTYDGAGRRTADGLYSMGTFQWQTSYSFGGDRATVTPPNGGTVSTTLTDARDRTAELDQQHGSSADATTYTYTPAGQQATMTDSAGNKWTYAHDLLGRQVSVSDPDTGTTTNTYDDLGRLTSTTDARGKTLSSTYDALGRKTAEYDTSGGAAETSSDQLAAWSYDTVSGAKGKLASTTRYQGGSAYTQTITGYDSAYRPTAMQISIPSAEGALAGKYSFGDTYNVDGTLATQSFPGGGGLQAETVNHTYDSLGQPDSTWGSGTGASDYVERTLWTTDMLPATYDLGLSQNAQWSAINFSYEPATRRMSEETIQRESNAWADDLDVKYGYDHMGDVTSASETVAGDYQCYVYDSLRRLTEAWAQGSSGCTSSPGASTIGGPSPYLDQLNYDATGNRTSETITYAPNNYVSYPQNTYPAAGTAQPHTLTSQQVVSSAYGYWTDTRTYDASGNTTNITTPHSNQTLTWDARDNLATIVDSVNNHTTTYVYDPTGGLLVRHDDSTATLYLPGEELTLSGGVVTGTRYYRHNGATIAVRTPSGVSWLGADQHGSDTVLIDASSQAVTQRRFMPFGAARGFPPAWIGDRGFVGGAVDSITGFEDLGAREYDPSTGRFLSADPVLESDDPQQVGGYAYAANNPLTFADPAGLMLCCGGGGPPPGPSGSGGGSTSGSGSGGGVSDYYYPVYHAYFVYQPIGSSRAVSQVRPEVNRGIVLVRLFIEGGTAAFGVLKTDQRGFSVDPNVSYRVAIAWNTGAGKVVTTISASTTFYGQRVHALPIGSIKTWQLEPPNCLHVGVCTWSRVPEPSPNQVHAQVSGGTLTINYQALNSVLPCCLVEGTMRIHLSSSGSTVHFTGDAYPSIEMYQYRRSQAPTVLARFTQADSGMSSLDFFHQATRTWVNGRLTSSSDSGIGTWGLGRALCYVFCHGGPE